jgi:hypothetical protein
LKAIAPTTPAHIVKALMNQEKPPAPISIQTSRQGTIAGINRQATALILNLPNQPVGGEDASDAQTLARITAIAVAYSVYKSFL